MSEDTIARDTGTGNFQRVYMTPNENLKQEDSAEKAIEEGRVRTEEENFRDQHKINIAEKPQEEPQEETLLAGKYKSPEELEKAYRELESKLGSKEPEEKEPTQEEVEKAISNLSDDLFMKGNDEYNQTGTISEATMKEFVKAGIPQSYVESYVDAMNAQAELFEIKFTQELGGEERIQEIVNWAVQNLSEKEVEAYNRLIDSGNIEEVITAYKSIEARMGNKPAKFISPQQGGSNDTGGYQSKAEMIAAMNDPAYKKDPAYRQKVISRLAKTKF